MFLGASSSARKSSSQFIDLNLVPREYRATGFPFLTAGLLLLVVGGLILGYSLFYVKTYSDFEVAALDKRVTQAQIAVQTATSDSAALTQAQKQRAMQADYGVLKQREINWGDVLQVIGATPSGVEVKEVSQAGFGITVTGSAANPAAVARYLDQLKNSGLFVNAALQTRPGSPPTVAPTFTPTSVPTVAPAAPAVAVVPVQPGAARVTVPTPIPTSSLPVYRPPTATPVRVAVATSTITRTPTITSTATPSATPTSAYDFALLSSQQLPLAKQNAPTSDIRGKVVDLSNNPVSGVTVEIDSEATSPWSAQHTTGPDGTFDFSVTHGKFQVFVVKGRSQVASDLYTGADGSSQVYDYQLVFQKTFSGGTPLDAGTPTVTPTATGTVTPSPSPVSFGANLANLGCASASDNSSSANLATDNNLGTEWNAGRAPSSGHPVWWKWVLPRTPGDAGCVAAGLSDNQLQIEAFQLIPDQNPEGTSVHELWLYADTACTQNLQTGGGPYYTFQQTTSTGEILPLKLSSAIAVRCVIVNSLADPSFVAWQEIQVYQVPEPPTGFPSLTPTPTVIATATATMTAAPGTPGSTPTPTSSLTVLPTTSVSATATLQGTATHSPTSTHTPTFTHTATPTRTPTASPTMTATATATPTATALPPPPGAANIAPQWHVEASLSDGKTFSTPVACGSSGGNPAVCNTIDQNHDTGYLPTSASADPQAVVLVQPPPVPSNSYIDDVRVTVMLNATPVASEVYQVQVNATAVACSTPTGATVLTDYMQIDCPIPTPAAGTTQDPIGKIAVVMTNGSGSESGNYGVREIEVYQWAPVSGQKKLDVARGPGGQGPGDDLIPKSTTEATPVRPGGQPTRSTFASPTSSPTHGGAPVDFTIVLELASGQGYGP